MLILSDCFYFTLKYCAPEVIGMASGEAPETGLHGPWRSGAEFNVPPDQLTVTLPGGPLLMEMEVTTVTLVTPKTASEDRVPMYTLLFATASALNFTGRPGLSREANWLLLYNSCATLVAL